MKFAKCSSIRMNDISKTKFCQPEKLLEFEVCLYEGIFLQVFMMVVGPYRDSSVSWFS